MLIAACRTLAEEEAARLLIVGDGPHRESFSAFAEEPAESD